MPYDDNLGFNSSSAEKPYPCQKFSGLAWPMPLVGVYGSQPPVSTHRFGGRGKILWVGMANAIGWRVGSYFNAKFPMTHKYHRLHKPCQSLVLAF